MKLQKKSMSLILCLIFSSHTFSMHIITRAKKEVQENKGKVITSFATWTVFSGVQSLCLKLFSKKSNPEKMGYKKLQDDFVSKQEFEDLKESVIYQQKGKTARESLYSILKGCYVTPQDLEEKNYINEEKLKDHLQEKEYVTKSDVVSLIKEYRKNYKQEDQVIYFLRQDFIEKNQELLGILKKVQKGSSYNETLIKDVQNKVNSLEEALDKKIKDAMFQSFESFKQLEIQEDFFNDTIMATEVDSDGNDV